MSRDTNDLYIEKFVPDPCGRSDSHLINKPFTHDFCPNLKQNFCSEISKDRTFFTKLAATRIAQINEPKKC